MERPVVGTGVIVRRGPKVLMGKNKGGVEDGKWGFPGGKVEGGEDPVADTAPRELDEETGVKAINYRRAPFWSNDLYPQADKHFITLYIVCDWLEGEGEVKEPEKSYSWDWFDWPHGLPRQLAYGIAELKMEVPIIGE